MALQQEDEDQCSTIESLYEGKSEEAATAPSPDYLHPHLRDPTVIQISTVKQNKLYIGGGKVAGSVSVFSPDPVDTRNVSMAFRGEGITRYFNAAFRKEGYVNTQVNLSEVKEAAANGDRVLVNHQDSTSSGTNPVPGGNRAVPKAPLAKILQFGFKLPKQLPSSFDGGPYGHIRYFLHCEVITDNPSPVVLDVPVEVYEHFVTVCEQYPLNIKNDDAEDQKMQLELVIDRPGFLPRDPLSFTCEVENMGKTPIKKMVAMLLQNVIFCRSSQHTTGRIKSFIMAAREQDLTVKRGETKEWKGDLMIPDPLPPTSTTNLSLIKIYYELIMVAVLKGKSSNVLKLYDTARYHYDIQCNRDECFRDFLPNVAVEIHIGSTNERGHVSGYMCEEASRVPTMNETVLPARSKSKSCV